MSWGLAILAGLALLRRAAAVTSGATLLGHFMFAYLVVIVIGAPIVYLREPGPTRGAYLLAVASVPLLVPFGAMLANRLFRFRPEEEIRAYHSRPITDSLAGPILWMMFLGILVISLVLVLGYLRSLGTIPLLAAFSAKSSALELALLRQQATSLYEGNRYLPNLGYNVLLPFLSFLALAKLLRYRSLGWLLTTLVVVAISTFMLAVQLQKALVVLFVVGLLTVLHLSLPRLPIRAVVLSLAAVGVLVLFLAYMINLHLPGSFFERLGRVTRGTSDRVFVGQTEPLYYYLEYFPTHHAFVPGQTIGVFARFFGVSFFPDNEVVLAYAHPESPLEHASAQTAFIADAYANLGFTGMLLSIPLVAFFVQVAQVLLTRARRDPLNIALFSFLALGAMRLAMTNPLRVLSSYGVAWILLLVLLMRAFYAIAHREPDAAPLAVRPAA